MNSALNYKGRFAPSPSGVLHMGSLVAAVGSYLDARAHNGKWLIRIEDLDPPRVKPGATDAILMTLERFGLEWDEKIIYQRHRTQAYQEALKLLDKKELIYPCSCSRREIAKTGRSSANGTIYPGTCLHGGYRPERDQHSLRVKTLPEPIRFSDHVYGDICQQLDSEVGDFVIQRSDGLTAYQLAVVIDDVYQQITHVVRGADLLYSTPRQIYLQTLLDLPQPEYAHLPLVVDQNGNKLSKQSHSLPVCDKDPLPALLHALNFLGQAPLKDGFANKDELLKWAILHWDRNKIPKHERIRPENRQGE